MKLKDKNYIRFYRDAVFMVTLTKRLFFRVKCIF